MSTSASSYLNGRSKYYKHSSLTINMIRKKTRQRGSINNRGNLMTGS